MERRNSSRRSGAELLMDPGSKNSRPPFAKRMPAAESRFDFSVRNLDIEFPVRRNLVYFNHAAVAPLPKRVSDAMTAYVEDVRDRGAAGWRHWYGLIEATRGTCARFLGAKPEEIAFLPNTSWGVNLVAQSFRWAAGDNVVSSDMEFPSNAYPWQRLRSRGVECRLAK